MYDVIISGYYGFNNSGDDALLMAIINNLRQYKKDINILVLSMRPKETQNIYGVDAINRFNIFQIIRAVKRSKLLINGGGSLIQDITSTQSLFYYLGIIKIAKSMGLKVMLYANGIGPIHKRFNRKISTRILNQVDMITLREEASKYELERLGVDKPPIKVTADPALTLQGIDDTESVTLLQQEGVDFSSPLIGFSVRDWEGSRTYVEIIAKVADYMVEKYKVSPVFIPMHYPRDVPIAHSIVSRMKQKAYVIKDDCSVMQMLGIVKHMELLIGMRLHSLIYAATFGIPVIGLVYEPKVEGFLHYARQASAGNVNQLQFEPLRELVDEIWLKRFEIRKELEKVTVELKEKALENAEIAVSLIQGR